MLSQHLTELCKISQVDLDVLTWLLEKNVMAGVISTALCTEGQICSCVHGNVPGSDSNHPMVILVKRFS
jgi:hypothetical protein